ncbi:ADP-ribosylation [Lophiostoma macrostomum CBS 122681]|uniref:ADP-ribosylation n=1 Tax=Lophiostoma macrostomum CBS 122681 TaxID=1314788 RepID=A0A6A6SJR1_9PLEO|nr:ADP-ribosylation [Lophiostoma macrostomum CBS 122681]
MYSAFFFIFFNLLAPLISGVAALGTLYRCDQRDPATVKAAGGFKSWGADTPSVERLYKHVEGTDTATDPFISTSTDIECGQHGKYRYTIDSSNITQKIWDVNAELTKAGGEDGFAFEMEQAVEFEIPWVAVISVEMKRGGFGWFEPMSMPAKQAPFAHDAHARLARI